MLSRCSLDCSVDFVDFDIGLRKISSFFSQHILTVNQRCQVE